MKTCVYLFIIILRWPIYPFKFNQVYYERPQMMSKSVLVSSKSWFCDFWLNWIGQFSQSMIWNRSCVRAYYVSLTNCISLLLPLFNLHFPHSLSLGNVVAAGRHFQAISHLQIKFPLRLFLFFPRMGRRRKTFEISLPAAHRHKCLLQMIRIFWPHQLLVSAPSHVLKKYCWPFWQKFSNFCWWTRPLTPQKTKR